jgi:hypothetical protein
MLYTQHQAHIKVEHSIHFSTSTQAQKHTNMLHSGSAAAHHNYAVAQQP